MRTIREIEFEIEMLERDISRTIVTQVSMDEQLRIWDRRVIALRKELEQRETAGN